MTIIPPTRRRLDPTARHPSRIYVVRWSRRRWSPTSDGATRWGRRIFTTPRGARRLADRLVDRDTTVEIRTYLAAHYCTVEVLPADDPAEEAEAIRAPF